MSEYHHKDLKNALFRAALKLLDEQGVAAVTIRAVAREVGVSHTAYANHYRDRKDLLTAVAKAQFDYIQSWIDKRLENNSLTPSQRVEIFAQALFDFGIKYPNRYQLLWRGDMVDHEAPELLESMDQVYDRLCDEIEVARPDLPFDRDTVAVSLWSMAHGYIDMRLTGMFEAYKDKKTGQPRPQAMLELFSRILG